MAGILIALATSQSLSFGEVLTGGLIFVFAATAYFLSTETESRAPTSSTSSNQRIMPTEQPVFQAAPASETTAADVGAVIEAYPEPALLTGLDGRVLAHNRYARDVFKLPNPALGLGSAIIRRADVLKSLKQVAETDQPREIEIEVSGTPDQFFKVHLSPLMLGKQRRVLIVLIELTELRRAEKARADFLANASHELRTPLTSLSGFIETMRGPAKDDHEAWDRFLEIMQNQTERMRRLIQDLLSLSRIELHEHVRPDEKIDLSSVARETVEAMTPVSKEAGIAVEFITSCEKAPVIGSRDELVQVMQNLLDNAVKYSGQGGEITFEITDDLDIDAARTFTGRRWADAARISIVQSRVETNDRFVAFRVSDEGDGIGRQHLPRLAERFYRVDEGRDRAVGGTGLGLAIVKHIVARHRGGLMVESQEGRGSAFGVWLPMANYPQSETVMPSDSLPGGVDK